jgi:hypothetical protein
VAAVTPTLGLRGNEGFEATEPSLKRRQANVVPSSRPENTTMQQIQLWIFWAIVGALIVCGYILTRKPTKKPPTETLRPAMPDEHQPSCFGLEEERGGSWKGSGGSVPSIREAKPSL